MGCRLDPRDNEKFLKEHRLDRGSASAALIAWTQYLEQKGINSERTAREAAAIHKHNVDIQRSNSEARKYNDARAEYLKALKNEQQNEISRLWALLEGFLKLYPTLSRWWAIPQKPAF
jgi:hypothetical protein